jgi:hypothetical protein
VKKSDLALTLLGLFSLAWLGWSFVQFIGSVMGDCDYDHDAACRLAKDYAPSLVLWRWLALQAVAVLGYVFYAEQRED